MHEAPRNENMHHPNEPCHYLKGASLVEGVTLNHTDLSIHLLSGIVPLGEHRPLQYDLR